MNTVEFDDEPCVCLEVAENEFERICQNARIITDVTKIKPDDLDTYNLIREDIIDAIMWGALAVDDNGVVSFLSECGKDFTFGNLIGGDYMRTDRMSEKEQMKKGVSLVAAMTKSEPKIIANLQGDDFQFLVKVAGFFMNSRKRWSRRKR